MNTAQTAILLALCINFSSAPTFGVQISRLPDPPPLPGQDVSRFIREIYDIGKRKDRSKLAIVQEAVGHEQLKVTLVALVTLGRLEDRTSVLKLSGLQLGAEAGAEHYHAAVRARINAATLVPLLNTSNDLARRVELYLKELNMPTEFLNRLPDEINALLRSGPDTMDTPRFREVAVNVLAEIVADAKAQGIDTSGVESRINLSLSGYWPLRSKLAALDRPGRIGALVKMLVESKHSYSRIVVQALANEGPAIIGPVTQQLRDLAKCRNEPRDRLEAVNGLTYTLAVLGDPAAIPVLERLADSNDDPKNIVSFSCRSTAKHLRRGFRFVLEPDY